MENLVIGRVYRFTPTKTGILRRMDNVGAYFEVNEPHTFELENDGLMGLPIDYAETLTSINEQPEDLHETQKKQILDYLKTGKSITKLEALKMFGCWNSGDCIFNLRKEGYNIETTMITNGKKRYASYKLIENGKEN